MLRHVRNYYVFFTPFPCLLIFFCCVLFAFFNQKNLLFKPYIQGIRFRQYICLFWMVNSVAN